MDPRLIEGRGRAARFGCIGIAILLFLTLICAKWAASLLIDYSWWTEMGQVTTWIYLYVYSTMPVVAGTMLTWIVLLAAHARAVHFAGGRVGDYPIYSRLSAVALLGIAF